MVKFSHYLNWLVSVGAIILAANLMNAKFEWLDVVEFSMIITTATTFVAFAMFIVGVVLTIYGSTSQVRENAQRAAFTSLMVSLATIITLDPSLITVAVIFGVGVLVLSTYGLRKTRLTSDYFNGQELGLACVAAGLLLANLFIGIESELGLFKTVFVSIFVIIGGYLFALGITPELRNNTLMSSSDADSVRRVDIQT